jgi:hypothetical protein
MMEEPVPRQFVFDCPECSVEMDVDASIRTEILTDGCVLCETPVDTTAFSHSRNTGSTD